MRYNPPEIINMCDIDLEGELLAGSVINTEETEVSTVGQEVITIDASEFTSSWE